MGCLPSSSVLPWRGLCFVPPRPCHFPIIHFSAWGCVVWMCHSTLGTVIKAASTRLILESLFLSPVLPSDKTVALGNTSGFVSPGHLSQFLALSPSPINVWWIFMDRPLAPSVRRTGELIFLSRHSRAPSCLPVSRGLAPLPESGESQAWRRASGSLSPLGLGRPSLIRGFSDAFIMSHCFLPTRSDN